MIEFNDNKPIYRQIVDYAFTRIITGSWTPGEMIPSVRELTIELGVNNRTVLKALDELQALHVIESRRGLGFMLVPNAADIICGIMKREFFENTLPQFVLEMKTLHIDPDEVMEKMRKML